MHEVLAYSSVYRVHWQEVHSDASWYMRPICQLSLKPFREASRLPSGLETCEMSAELMQARNCVFLQESTDDHERYWDDYDPRQHTCPSMLDIEE